MSLIEIIISVVGIVSFVVAFSLFIWFEYFKKSPCLNVRFQLLSDLKSMRDMSKEKEFSNLDCLVIMRNNCIYIESLTKRLGLVDVEQEANDTRVYLNNKIFQRIISSHFG